MHVRRRAPKAGRPGAWRAVHLPGVLGAVGALLLPGCSQGVLDPHGPVAAAERLIMFDALAIMLAIAIPTILFAIGVVWWFRSTNPRARRLPGFVHSGRVEIVIWTVPLLTVLFLSGLIWTGSHALDPYKRLPAAPGGRELEVEVVALDWKWLFIYPEQGVASVNRMPVPVGVPVHLNMTSASVMNTFYVPQLAGMIYVMNGMVTQLSLQADHPGAFKGRSGHFSGDGYSAMQFTTDAMPPEQFDRWVSSTRDAADSRGTLDRAAYEQLERQDIPPAPFTFRAVDAGLFRAIATQEIPPAGGPTSGHGGVGVKEEAQK